MNNLSLPSGYSLIKNLSRLQLFVGALPAGRVFEQQYVSVIPIFSKVSDKQGSRSTSVLNIQGGHQMGIPNHQMVEPDSVASN